MRILIFSAVAPLNLSPCNSIFAFLSPFLQKITEGCLETLIHAIKPITFMLYSSLPPQPDPHFSDVFL